MKKFLALLLVAAVVCSLGVSAIAAGSPTYQPKYAKTNKNDKAIVYNKNGTTRDVAVSDLVVPVDKYLRTIEDDAAHATLVKNFIKNAEARTDIKVLAIMATDPDVFGDAEKVVAPLEIDGTKSGDSLVIDFEDGSSTKSEVDEEGVTTVEFVQPGVFSVGLEIEE